MTSHEREEYYDPPEIECSVQILHKWRADLEPESPGVDGMLTVPLMLLPDHTAVGDIVTLTFGRDTPSYPGDYSAHHAPSDGASGRDVEYP